MAAFGKLHYINVGPHGTFRPSGDLQTTPAEVDALFQHLEAEGVDKVVVHFHGGLVGESSGLGVARSMFELLEAEGHPLTFVWETGLVETVRSNLEDIHDTKFFQKAVRYVLRHAAKRLGGGIGGKGPGEAMTLQEVARELEREAIFEEFDAGARNAAASLDEADLDEDLRAEIETDLEEDLDGDEELDDIVHEEMPETELLDPAFVEEVAEEEAKGVFSAVTVAAKLAKVVFRVLRRYVRKRDHGFYPTVVEEVLRELYVADVGAWVWGSMKEAAESMWHPNVEPVGEDGHPGDYFLDKLLALRVGRPGLTVDLIGHSAGSIAICHMLRRLAERGESLAIRNILFLAPACRSELFHEEIVARPERYQHFRMFTMGDGLETKDRLVRGVYTRSLLYFISGVLEPDLVDAPIAGLELQSRGQDPYTTAELLAIRDFLRPPAALRLVLSETESPDPGLSSSARAHGDFDNDPLTRESIRAIVSN